MREHNCWVRTPKASNTEATNQSQNHSTSSPVAMSVLLVSLLFALVFAPIPPSCIGVRTLPFYCVPPVCVGQPCNWASSSSLISTNKGQCLLCDSLDHSIAAFRCCSQLELLFPVVVVSFYCCHNAPAGILPNRLLIPRSQFRFWNIQSREAFPFRTSNLSQCSDS